MKDPIDVPPRVDPEAAWTNPPETPSPRVAHWLDRFAAGWRPNRRIRQMGYYGAAEFFGVTIWEWRNVLWPLYREES